MKECKILVKGKVTFIQGSDGSTETERVNERTATVSVDFQGETFMDDYLNGTQGGVEEVLKNLFEHFVDSIREELEFLPPLQSNWHLGSKINKP